MRLKRVIDIPERMGGEIYYREHDFAHDPELHHAYKCGVKQGWREAMEETHGGHYAERHYGRVGMPPMYREHPEHNWEDDAYMERRRDSRGRFM